MKYVLGIDLGTTNTFAAVLTQGKKEPELLSIRQPIDGFGPEHFDYQPQLPSALAMNHGLTFVGQAARELVRHGHGKLVILSAKRHMGTSWSRKIGEGNSWAREWTPEQVSGCILKTVLEAAQTRFGTDPQHVVITVPASFGSEARSATLRAAKLAGFNLKRARLFDEPTAALLDQITREQEQSVGEERLLIVDIGGGTLDSSLIRMKPVGSRAHIDILGRSRYNELAGDDFDMNLAGLLLYYFEDKRGKVTLAEHRFPLFSELLYRAEKAKIALSEMDSTENRDSFAKDYVDITVHRTPDGRPWEHRVTIDDLRMALSEFFPFKKKLEDRQRDLTFFRPIEECLESSKLVLEGKPCAVEDVNRIYLTGGSASLTIMKRAVNKRFGKEARTVAQPMHAVALGAARYAAMIAGIDPGALVAQDRLLEGLYLQTQTGFDELIPPSASVPSGERRKMIQTSAMDRRCEIALFIGADSEDTRMTPLARRQIDFGELLPAGTPIELRVQVSEHRHVELTGSVQHNGQNLKGIVNLATSVGWLPELGDVHDELPEVNSTPLEGA